MITCKEGLRNTQASGDLVVPFQELAFKLGIGWGPNGNDMVVRENYEVIVCGDFGHGLELAHRHNLKDCLKQLTLSDLKPTKQYAVLYKGCSYSFQSDKPVGDDVVACFDLAHSERPLSEDFFDEKPRTKVEYEKVEFEPNEIWKAFKEHQEVGYLYVNTSDGFECLFDGVFNLAMAISQGDQLYRRIETEIDERQEFIDSFFDAL